MGRASTGFGGGGIGFPPVPRLTRLFIGVFVVGSILAGVLGPWAKVVNLWELFAFRGDDVLSGQVWRLLTYPWLADTPFGLIFGALGFVFFVGRLEMEWGRRLFVRRLLVLVLAPVLLLTLLSAFVPTVGSRAVALGPTMLIVAALTAFASELRGRSIVLFPIPFQLTGDMILWLEGGMLALSVLFAGEIIPYLAPILSFGIALAWFRLNVVRDIRRAWLRMKKKRLSKKLEKTRTTGRGHLRVVRDDKDDDEPKRYLH